MKMFFSYANIHLSHLNHCFETRGTRSLWNVFEAVQKLAARVLSGLKTLLLVFLSITKIFWG